jgi:hypothetical protein
VSEKYLFKGKHIARDLYKIGVGNSINVNSKGSKNIAKKVIPDIF